MQFFSDESVAENNFYLDSGKVKGDINIRLMKFHNALRFYEAEEKELESKDPNKKWAKNCDDLLYVHKYLGDFEKSKEYGHKSLAIRENYINQKLILSKVVL